VNDWQPFVVSVEDVTGGNRKVQLRDYVDTGSLPVIDQGKNFIGGYTNDHSSAYLGRLPCVVFGDHTKILKYVDFPFALGADGVKVLAPRLPQLEAKFLYHYLRSRKLPNAGYSRHFKFLKDIHVPIPPLDEQRRILGLLDRAAEIRRRADAARAKARAIIPALFLDTFGDPATNPKGWPVVELGDVISRITGGKNIEAGNGTSKYRIMKVSAVTSGIFKAHESKPAPDDHIPAEDHHVSPGDFLFSRANTSELVGAVAIAEDVPEGLLLPDKIWRIEWTPTRIEPRFAYSLLRSSEIRRIFAVIGSGTSGSMKNISQAKLVRVPIPLPPLDIQSAFAEQASRLESFARHLDAAAAKAEAMAAGLSAEVFG
jgi:type I restriction enzyme S subunit